MQTNSASRDRRNVFLILALSGILVVTTTLVLPSAIRPAFAQNVAVVEVDVREVAQGYRASELTGSNVENSAGETIGSIDDLIVDREKVLFAILQIGGFLGIGGHLVAVPYNSLEIDAGATSIVLAEGSREELETLPEFEYEEE